MNKAMYSAIENHMLGLMKDSAHDCQHIYRVLHYSLEIARGTEADAEVLIAAALLHDIGRAAEYADPAADHAKVGAEMAYGYLVGMGWPEGQARHVRACILTHRYRSGVQPDSPEARILFDADKLDATGVVGIARTMMYKALVGQPLYQVNPDGTVSSGEGDKQKSVLQEYNWKLKGIYGKFYTKRAEEIALEHRQAAIDCYDSLVEEVRFAHEAGNDVLDGALVD